MTTLPQRHGSTPAASTAPPDARARRSLFAIGVGNVLEWFDWVVYAVFSPFIAAALFEPADDLSALLSTLAVFAVGFLMRPVGGVVFGALADRLGRRFVLISTMLTMAGGSLLIALTPSFAQVGVLASALLLIARLAQGLAHGGESATSYAYVSEIAPPARRGLWSSAVFVAVTVGTLLATGLGALLTTFLSEAQMAAWGWRVPFLVGAGLALYALFLRRGMMESHVFTAQSAAGSTVAAPTEQSSGDRGRLLVAGVRLVVFTAGTTVVFYTWGTFTSGYAITVRGMDAQTAFTASFLAQLVALVSLPLWGMLSDRVGRRPVALGFAGGFVVLAFPLNALIGTAGWTLFTAQAVALVLWAAVASIYPCLMSEQLPTRHRAKGIGIASSLSVALFGGTAPYLATWLGSLGLTWVFTAYLVLLCVATAVATLTMRETRAIDLADAT